MPRVFREMVQHGAFGGILLVSAAFLAILIANSPLAEIYQNILALPVAVTAGGFELSLIHI